MMKGQRSIWRRLYPLMVNGKCVGEGQVGMEIEE